MVLAVNGFVVGWAVLMRCWSGSMSMRRTWPRLPAMWWAENREVLRFSLGSDASTAFMSVERTSVSAHPPALLATDDGVNGGGYPAVLMHLLVRGAF